MREVVSSNPGTCTPACKSASDGGRTRAFLAPRVALAATRAGGDTRSQGWHDSCLVVHAESRAGAPGTSPLYGSIVVLPIHCALGVKEEHWTMRADRRHGTGQQRRGQGKSWCKVLMEANWSGRRRHGIATSDAYRSTTGKRRSAPKSSCAAMRLLVSHESPRVFWRCHTCRPAGCCESMSVHGQVDVW
jgi:hypothetical protein